MRPRWVLRYLTRLGISMAGSSCLLGGAAQHFALEDPDLPSDGPRRGVRGGQAVVDVGADGVKRDPSLPVPFASGDLSPAQPARARDADPVGAQTERGRDRLLHG